MSTVQLTVDGMTCGGCSGRLKRVMEQAEGISTADIELKTKQVVVAFDSGVIDQAAIEAIVKEAGFTVVAA